MGTNAGSGNVGTLMVFTSLALLLAAQEPTAPPAAKMEDVKSIDSIVKSLYDVISGPAGQKRDWDRFRSLFSAKGTLSALVKNRQGEMVLVIMTPGDYISRSGKVIEERGFFEKEVKRESKMVNDIAHVFSDYESRNKLEEEKPFQVGTNAIQLYSDGKRWYIHSVLWQGK